MSLIQHIQNLSDKIGIPVDEINYDNFNNLNKIIIPNNDTINLFFGSVGCRHHKLILKILMNVQNI